MKIAILGGGFTGLTAAYYLQKKGHDITIYEQNNNLGGLAAGFKEPEWNWHIERAYHHLFTSDHHINRLAKDIGFDGIYYQTPETSSLYKVENNYRTFPLDSPQNLLTFPLLSLPERLRVGAVMAFLKYAGFKSIYEHTTAHAFLTRYMGDHAYQVMFGELFRKKFGKYAEKILTSFIWARIVVRTNQLGYVKGGFQTFIDHLSELITENGNSIHLQQRIEHIEKKGEGFELTIQDLAHESNTNELFDLVISTVPTPVLTKLGEHIFPAQLTNNFRNIEYLNAVCLILETEKPILPQAYWLNICAPELPTMLVAQHTNFVEKEHYGGKHLAYTANYVEKTHPLITMDNKQVYDHYVSQLMKINPDFDGKSSRYYVFKAPFAQPIIDEQYLAKKPTFATPVENFFVANLDMTYPYERGTNFAVKLGRDVSEMI
jgi:protoporphyrinogen oxidase